LLNSFRNIDKNKFRNKKWDRFIVRFRKIDSDKDIF
jgi:hypothetical protein